MAAPNLSIFVAPDNELVLLAVIFCIGARQ
jgi:hypothetical protein